MRLFLGIEPDRPAEGQIGRLLLDVQRAMGDAASMLRWTPANNVHITLHFLGELDAGRITNVTEVLGDAVNEPAFPIAIDSIGLLPPVGAPRILWAGVGTGADALKRVYAELGERVRSAGLPTETRAFLPHLTLARVPDRERRHARGLRERLAQAAIAPSIAWQAEHVTLFRSDLSGPVPKYDAIHRIGLRS